jgi:hypothetical protein
MKQWRKSGGSVACCIHDDHEANSHSPKHIQSSEALLNSCHVNDMNYQNNPFLIAKETFVT